MARWTIAMYWMTSVICVSTSRDNSSLNVSSHNPQQYLSPSPSPIPPTVSANEIQTSSSKQPLQSLKTKNAFTEFEQKKEREFQQLVNAILSSNSHSSMQYRPHLSEAPQRSTDDDFSASHWDFPSIKWTMPQFGPKNAIPSSLLSPFIDDLQSHFDEYAKQFDDHNLMPKAEEIREMLRSMQLNKRQSLMPEIITQAFSFMKDPTRADLSNGNAKQPV